MFKRIAEFLKAKIHQKIDYFHSSQFKMDLKREVCEWVRVIIYALVLAVIVRTFIIQPFKIPSESMVPTLKIGDRVLVNMFIYGSRVPPTYKHLPGLRFPKRGEIIVFVEPIEKKRAFIKRAIAFGGETVEIKDGDVYINDQRVEDPVIRRIYYYNTGKFPPGYKLKIPKDHIFVLGDNSRNSRDSREWGTLHKKYLVGKAMLIFWPIKRISLLKR